jgi:hypothetical protein
MDPGAEVTTREEIEKMGLVVVGWYHSHPTFEPMPSVIDITNHAIHQGHNRNIDHVQEYDAPPRPGRSAKTEVERSVDVGNGSGGSPSPANPIQHHVGGDVDRDQEEYDDGDEPEPATSGRGALRGSAKMGSREELYIAAIISPYGVSTRAASSEVRRGVWVRVS